MILFGSAHLYKESRNRLYNHLFKNGIGALLRLKIPDLLMSSSVCQGDSIMIVDGPRGDGITYLGRKKRSIFQLKFLSNRE